MILNRAFLEFPLCDRRHEIESNAVRLELVDVEIHKQGPECNLVTVGEIVQFNIAIRNNSAIELQNVEFRDPLNQALRFVEGTFCVDGQQRRPEFHCGVLTFRFPQLRPGARHSISYDVRVVERNENENERPERPERPIRRCGNQEFEPFRN